MPLEDGSAEPSGDRLEPAPSGLDSFDRRVRPPCTASTLASFAQPASELIGTMPSTPLKWIQEQGGWRSAKLLLDVYDHFMRLKMSGYAGALTAPDGTKRGVGVLTWRPRPDSNGRPTA